MALHRRYPELKLWMTEVCHAYETDTPRSHPMPYRDYADGDFWGNLIFNDLEAGTSAWIYWNMILDENGGPWLVSPVHGDPEKNAQHPVVIVDRNKKEVTYTALYYYLAHFSKFVRPGAVRVGTDRVTQGRSSNGLSGERRRDGCGGDEQPSEGAIRNAEMEG